uniref:Uncharacterized protein n=1 Tax=Oryza brachyantha TaxID=4533 RepID=J3LCU6_ORYBR
MASGGGGNRGGGVGGERLDKHGEDDQLNSSSDSAGIVEGLRSLCTSMDSMGFFTFLVARRKEVNALCTEMLTLH